MILSYNGCSAVTSAMEKGRSCDGAWLAASSGVGMAIGCVLPLSSVISVANSLTRPFFDFCVIITVASGTGMDASEVKTWAIKYPWGTRTSPFYSKICDC